MGHAVLLTAIHFVTCSLYPRYSIRTRKSPPSEAEDHQQSCSQQNPCKCGKRQYVYRRSEYVGLYSIGILTWAPCPVHPCAHSPSETNSAMKDQTSGEIKDTIRIDSNRKCLCSFKAQVEANPEISNAPEPHIIQTPFSIHVYD